MTFVIASIIKSIALVLILLLSFAYMTYYERKVLSRFHVRSYYWGRGTY